MDASTTKLPVLIVGAGPAGLTLAALLHRLGVGCAIIERHSSRLALPKAHVINPVTLDVCAAAGFDVQEMVAQATPPAVDSMVRFRARLTGEEIGALPFERQQPGWVARPRINLAQPKFEALQEQHVRALPDVDWVSGRWLSYECHDGVVVSCVRVDGRAEYIASDLLVGADGAGSSVRAAAGIDLQGQANSQAVMSVHFRADLRAELAGAPAAMYWNLDPEVVGGFIAHDIAGSWVYNYYPSDGQVPDAAQAAERVRAAIGRPVDLEVVAVSPWVRGSQVAARMSEGPVFLIGDAAHRLPPTGGLGLNTGVQDAANLAWKIAAVRGGWGGPGLLGSYDAERRPIAVTNTAQSAANAATIRALHHSIGAAIAEGRLAAMPDIEVAGLIDAQWDGHNSPGLQLGYQYGVPWPVDARVGSYTPSAEVGRRLPHVLLGGGPGGNGTPVHDLLDPTTFTLITPEPADDWALLAKLAAVAAVPVSVLSLQDRPPADPCWLDVLPFAGCRGVLVRPDGHVAAHVAGPDESDVAPVLEAVRAYLRDGVLFRPTEPPGTPPPAPPTTKPASPTTKKDNA